MALQAQGADGDAALRLIQDTLENRAPEETTVATSDPALDLSFSPGSPTQSLMFSLLTGAESQASGAANQSAFYTVNATPQLSEATTQVPQEAIGDGQTPGGGVAACQLEKGDIVLVEGLIRLQQAPPPTGDGSDRVLGTLRLETVVGNADVVKGAGGGAAQWWFAALDQRCFAVGTKRWTAQVVGIHVDGLDVWIQLESAGTSFRSLLLHVRPGMHLRVATEEEQGGFRNDDEGGECLGTCGVAQGCEECVLLRGVRCISRESYQFSALPD